MHYCWVFHVLPVKLWRISEKRFYRKRACVCVHPSSVLYPLEMILKSETKIKQIISILQCITWDGSVPWRVIETLGHAWTLLEYP